jgi:DNA-directed RNA polymerase specialized sigma24 family protein
MKRHTALRCNIRARLERRGNAYLAQLLDESDQATVELAADVLVERHLAVIERVCRGGLKPGEVADAVAISAQRYYVALLRGQVRSPAGLAATIAKKECVEVYDERRMRAERNAPWDPEQIGLREAPDDPIGLADARYRLRLVGERLTENERATARGKALGLTAREAAAEAGKRTNTVEVARARLKKKYGPEFE